jgi:hypothetical protein
MTDLTVLVPTRGRVANAIRLAEAMTALNRADTQLVLGVDADDEDLDAYRKAAPVTVVEPAGPGMVGALNQLVARHAADSTCLAFLGDDHVPRTEGWDARLVDAIATMGGGVAYGNDLVHGINLPTAVALDARLVQALGYMAPPTLRHLYVDNVWKDWGYGLGRLAYLNDVVIEHLHPIVGKAENDERYQAVNTGTMFNRDQAAYQTYCVTQLNDDLATMRNAL